VLLQQARDSFGWIAVKARAELTERLTACQPTTMSVVVSEPDALELLQQFGLTVGDKQDLIRAKRTQWAC
jgi:hypothetical protein